MNEATKISFVGFGNMAKALVQGLSNQMQYQIFASAPSLKPGVTEEGIHIDNDNINIAKDAAIVILAVKPHQMETVLKEIQPHLAPDCVLVSIAAGLPLSFFTPHLAPTQSLVRCMPNIAVAFQEGATPLIANQNVTSQQKQFLSNLFSHVGITTWLENENDMNIFTALSGSGPAYVFLFLEALQKAAEKLGLNTETARNFSRQTLTGALSYLQNTDLNPEEAREKVTSKHGTTAAAIAVLQTQGFEDLIADALEAACLRAAELGA